MSVNGEGIDVQSLIEKLSSVQVVVPTPRSQRNGEVPKASAQELVQVYRENIPLGILQRLSAGNAVGDRSKVLWRLTTSLLESGLSPGEVLVVVEHTPWNKFAGDRGRLWADINAAVQHVDSNNGGDGRDTQGALHNTSGGRGKKDTRVTRDEPWAVPVSSFLAKERVDPKWMIEGLWSDKSHGIVAGEPKTRKSYLAIDIAVSVATGTKCLGYFEVPRPAPVLMIQEEISDAEMAKRLRWIIASKGLSGSVEHGEDGAISVQLPHEIDLYVRNRKSFDLTSTDSLEQMTNIVVDLSAKLVILDPLQMMLGSADENRTSEVRPMLVNLLKFKEATGCGVMILHHYNKAGSGNPRTGGQRMSGSHALHGWVESALYLEKPEPYVTHVEREFRNFEPFGSFDVEFIGDEQYEVVVTEQKAKERKVLTELEKYVAKYPNGVTLTRAAQTLEMTKDSVVRRIEKSQYIETKDVKGKTGRPSKVLFFKPSN